MKTVRHFLEMKTKKEPITMITAYDYPSATFVERAEADCILVGDSLGMVVLGYDSTIAVTVDEMIHHAKAVRRGAPNTWTVVDMPFMSYHISMEDTLRNARKIIQETGAQALKVEGAEEVVDVIRRLTHAGVPVVAHLGLTPQSVGVLGGYRVQGKTEKEAEKLLSDALLVQEAGAVMLVLECVPEEVSTHISKRLTIPVIGIGAGRETDGQVLVYHDVIGYGEHRIPKFVKKYSSVAESIQQGIADYVAEVKSGAFPEEKHTFHLEEETLVSLYGGKK